LREFLHTHKNSSYIGFQEFPKNVSDELYNIFDQFGFSIEKNSKSVKTAINKKKKKDVDNVTQTFMNDSDTEEDDIENGNIDVIFDKVNQSIFINVYIPNGISGRFGCPEKTIEKLYNILMDISIPTKQNIVLFGDLNVPLWDGILNNSATPNWCSYEQKLYKRKISEKIRHSLMKKAHLEDTGAHNNLHTTFGGTRKNTARIDYFLSNMPGFTYVDSNNYGSQHKAITCYVLNTCIKENNIWSVMDAMS